MTNKNDFLTHVPPMGIYETLYRFLNSFGMGGVSQPSQLYALKLFDKNIKILGEAINSKKG